MTTIDNNNYELWLLRYAEGDLTASEREVVEAWLAEHPEAAEELALYNEAPRLEADESIQLLMPAGCRRSNYYSAPVLPLWPAVLRWSAAAAVVVALMVPALRMGTMDTLESPAPLFAEAVGTKHLSASKALEDSGAIKGPKAFKHLEAVKEKKNIEEEYVEETITALPDSFEPTIIEVNTLIAFETEWVKEDTLYTTALIAYDRSADWGDVLLAANDAYRESLNERPLGRMVSRALPDNRQLEENVVEPLREKIDNIKSIIK